MMIASTPTRFRILIVPPLPLILNVSAMTWSTMNSLLLPLIWTCAPGRR